MSLKLNQTRLYMYMTHLVEALNAKNAELDEARTALEANVRAVHARQCAPQARATQAPVLAPAQLLEAPELI